MSNDECGVEDLAIGHWAMPSTGAPSMGQVQGHMTMPAALATDIDSACNSGRLLAATNALTLAQSTPLQSPRSSPNKASTRSTPNGINTRSTPNKANTKQGDCTPGSTNTACAGCGTPGSTHQMCAICLSPVVNRKLNPRRLACEGSRTPSSRTPSSRTPSSRTPSSRTQSTRGFKTACCGQLLHKGCLKRYKEQAPSSPSRPTNPCPLCRSATSSGLTPIRPPKLHGLGFVSAAHLHTEMSRRISTARGAVARSLAARAAVSQQQERPEQQRLTSPPSSLFFSPGGAYQEVARRAGSRRDLEARLRAGRSEPEVPRNEDGLP